MNNETISSLQQMDKEELIQQILALRQENESLLERATESEARFRAFADNIQAAVYLLDEQGAIIYANPFASSLTGYTNAEILQLPGFNLIHPDDLEISVARNQARLRGEKTPGQYDIRLQVKDGQIKWVEFHMEVYEWGGQKVTLGTAIDITERKKVEDDLRRSEEKFKTFTENAQVMIYTFDSKGRFTYVNKICEVLSGYTKEELLGMHFTQLLHDDYKSLSLKRAASRRADEISEVSYDYVAIKKDGSLCWWELSGVPLVGADGEVTVLGSAIDITDRVKSKQALKESEEKFRVLFERSSDPMLLLDGDGFFDCNAAALKLLKAANKDEISMYPSKLSPAFQPDGLASKSKADVMIKQAYATGFHRFEWLHCDLQGREFWADVSLTVVPFKNREIIYTVWRDISKVKELEHLLRDEREQLLVTLRSIGDAVITTDLTGKVKLMNRVAEHLTGWRQSEAIDHNVDEVLDIVSVRTREPAQNPLDQAISKGVILELEDNIMLRSRNGQEFKIADSASPIRDENSEIIGGVLVFRDVTDRERMQEEVFKLRKL
ncbi:MAG: PAS domain S-box protein, partial [Deltaproteobacteria bacterium]|nr:PAS domain S-box protein [Candidatus Tharpella sp.]